MNAMARHAAAATAWVAGYVAAGTYAVLFTSLPGAGPLFSPAAGVALALVVHQGLRWAWLVPLALLVHLAIWPPPAGMLPWMLAASLAGVLAGGWLAIRGTGHRRGLVRDGMQVMLGGLLMALVAGAIEVAGRRWSGTAAWPQLGGLALRQVLGDFLGVVSVSPALLLALGHGSRTAPRDGLPGRAGEGLLWNIALLASFLLMAWGMSLSHDFALGLSALPLAVMLWSALRLSPLRTALSVLLSEMLLGSFAGLGLAGFHATHPTFETAILLLYLCLMAVLPLVLSLTVAEHRAAVAKLELRASVDPLSGLPNRGTFEARVRQSLLDPSSVPLALAYLDLDNLKLVNDTASHRVGDALIVSVAGALRAQMQAGDLIGHLGGDEFVMLLYNASPTIARERAHALLRAVENSPCRVGDEQFGTTASIGLVQFHPEQAEFAEALSQADAACFTAKELGGDRVCVAGHADADPTSSMRWTVRIRDALQNDGFLLYAQSIAPLHPAPGPGCHFELLLRMRGTDAAVHSPERFIAAAERFQLASRVDRQVVRMALDWLEAHPGFSSGMSLCAINLSAGTVLDDGFLGFIAERLQRSSIPADRLCFEITETSAMRDPARAQRVIDALRSLGCRFALDDFGTGFCSFGHLRALDVDFIKIDGSFVRDLETSPLAAEVVGSITRIAHLLRKRTIAEHTETAAVRAALTAMGVDYAQGYAIDRPQPLDEYAAAVQAGAGG